MIYRDQAIAKRVVMNNYKVLRQLYDLKKGMDDKGEKPGKTNAHQLEKSGSVSQKGEGDMTFEELSKLCVGH
jgi:hypothetical protein